MKKWLSLTALFLLLMAFSSMAHKFYVSIYQLHFAPEKNRLEVTGRIFIDDLNACLSKASGRKTHIGEKGEKPEDIAALKRYLLSHITISVDAKLDPLEFVKAETEENVVICYLKVNKVSNPRLVSIKNSALMDWNSGQQNIIQADVYGIKKSAELDEDTLFTIFDFKK